MEYKEMEHNYNRICDYLRSSEGLELVRRNLESSMANGLLEGIENDLNSKEDIVDGFLIGISHIHIDDWAEDEPHPSGLKGSTGLIYMGIEGLLNDDGRGVRKEAWDTLLGLVYLSRLRALEPTFAASVQFILPVGKMLRPSGEVADIIRDQVGIDKDEAEQLIRDNPLMNISLADNTSNIFRYQASISKKSVQLTSVVNAGLIDQDDEGYKEFIPRSAEGIDINDLYFYMNSMDITKLRRKIMALPNGVELLSLNQNMFSKLGMEVVDSIPTLADKAPVFRQFFYNWNKQTLTTK